MWRSTALAEPVLNRGRGRVLPDMTDTQSSSDATIQARQREIVAEHLLFTTLRFLAERHPELLDALDASVNHLGDPGGGATQDDEAVRDIARRFVASLRAEART